jgi:hypothetical protein
MTRRLAVFAAIALVLAACQDTDQVRGTTVHVTASGDAQVETGELFGNTFQPATARLQLTATDTADGGGRVTPLPPHDAIDLTAHIEAQSRTFDVRATHAMISDPLGRFTTWWGVGLNVDHHGHSGIGTSKLPPIVSTVAVFALGEVSANGQVIATNVPVHVMTASGGLANNASLELDLGDPDAAPIVGLPDGHLRVLWRSSTVDAPQTAHVTRYAIGSVLLIAAILGALWLNRREPGVIAP